MNQYFQTILETTWKYNMEQYGKNNKQKSFSSFKQTNTYLKSTIKALHCHYEKAHTDNVVFSLA